MFSMEAKTSADRGNIVLVFAKTDEVVLPEVCPFVNLTLYPLMFICTIPNIFRHRHVDYARLNPVFILEEKEVACMAGSASKGNCITV